VPYNTEIVDYCNVTSPYLYSSSINHGQLQTSVLVIDTANVLDTFRSMVSVAIFPLVHGHFASKLIFRITLCFFLNDVGLQFHRWVQYDNFT